MGDVRQPSTSAGIQSSKSNDENEERIQAQLKSDYMDLLDEFDNLGEIKNVKETVKDVNTAMDRVENLVTKVTDTVGLYLDAMTLQGVTTVLQDAFSNMDVGEKTFKLIPFAQQLRSKAVNSDGICLFETFMETAAPIVYNSLPEPLQPMHGALTFADEMAETNTEKDVSSVIGQKAQRKPRNREKLADMKEPEKVTQLESSGDTTEVIVQTILKVLKRAYKDNRRNPISYFRFVVDPKSFSKTVENIFHVSFLIRDGHVSMEIPPGEEEPYISPRTQGKENSNPKKARMDGRPAGTVHNIVSITPEEWRALVDVMEITAAMIPSH